MMLFLLIVIRICAAMVVPPNTPVAYDDTDVDMFGGAILVSSASVARPCDVCPFVLWNGRMQRQKRRHERECHLFLQGCFNDDAQCFGDWRGTDAMCLHEESKMLQALDVPQDFEADNDATSLLIRNVLQNAQHTSVPTNSS